MSTIDSRQIAHDIIRMNGMYGSDPQVHRVYAYVSGFEGKTCFKLLYTRKKVLEPSKYVRAPTLLFDYEDGLTPDGEEFMTSPSTWNLIAVW